MTSPALSQPLINRLVPVRNDALRVSVQLAAGVVLMALLSQLRLQIGPVPLTGQTLGVLLIGAAYGFGLGGLTMLAYLLVGGLGLGVFSGGAAGWAVFTGATAGYLLGFPVAAAVVGFLAQRGFDRRVSTTALAMLVGNLIIYVPGLLWLNQVRARLAHHAAVGPRPVRPRRRAQAALGGAAAADGVAAFGTAEWLRQKSSRAGFSILDELARLFDLYRQFYRQASDVDGAKTFLRERLTGGDSVIFVAFLEGAPAGFTQLYPSLSSVLMQPIWILNDLFVTPDARRQGVAEGLMEHAAAFAKEAGAARLSLRTEVTNEQAQALYEKLGWRQNTAFLTYDLTL